MEKSYYELIKGKLCLSDLLELFEDVPGGLDVGQRVDDIFGFWKCFWQGHIGNLVNRVNQEDWTELI